MAPDNKTSRLDAVLDYIREGFAVFPCGEDKAPLIPEGFKGATTSEGEAVAWWSGLYPDALIGVPIPEGHVVLDVDPRNGGTDSLRALMVQNGRLPSTRKARTRSNGVHLWFRYDVPEGAKFRKVIARGVDIKTPGKGYVIVPPSPGYVWRSYEEPAPLPEWVSDLALKPEPAERQNVKPIDGTPKFFPFEEGTRYGLKARDAELARLMSTAEGGRNDALNTAAFNLAQLVAGGELGEEATLARLNDMAERIGLEAEEIARTVESGWAAGAESPREAPEQDSEGDSAGAPGTPFRRSPVPLDGRYWTDWQIDEPPPPFYHFPLLPKNAYVIVYGATEAAKSMVWAGLLADASHHGIRSSIYSLENPRHVDRDRLRRLSPDPDNLRITHEPLDLGSREDVEAFIEREGKWGTNVALIDTYSHAFSSVRSEDGNARAIAFAQVVRYIMHELNDQGLSIVVVDHTGYMNTEEPRDASAKRQQVDVAIRMEKVDQWKPGATRSRFKMDNFKASRFGNPFSDVHGSIVGARGEPLFIEWADKDFGKGWAR